MRLRVFTVLVLGALVVGGSAASASAGVLYNQNGGSPVRAVISQNFEPKYDASDSWLADDFTVPAGHKWRIRRIDVTGEDNTGGVSAPSENVTFYRDLNGQPGAVVNSQTVVGSDHLNGLTATSTGSYWIALTGFRLRAGTYWVSVQVNENFDPSGDEWHWGISSGSLAGASAMFQNPGDGYATGCTTWGTIATCNQVTAGSNLMFDLRGRQI